jgi:hypothetical protein
VFVPVENSKDGALFKIEFGESDIEKPLLTLSANF